MENKFLDIVMREVQNVKQTVLIKHKESFFTLIKRRLKPGDIIYVANGTVLIQRGNIDSTENAALERVAAFIQQGVYDIGFEMDYKTIIE